MRLRAGKQLRDEPVVDARVALDRRARADATRVHADHVEALVQGGVPEMAAGRLHRDREAAWAPRSPGIDDEAADPMRRVSGGKPVKAERDLRAARMVV